MNPVSAHPTPHLQPGASVKNNKNHTRKVITPAKPMSLWFFTDVISILMWNVLQNEVQAIAAPWELYKT